MGGGRGGPHGRYEVGLGSPKSSPLLIVRDLRKLSIPSVLTAHLLPSLPLRLPALSVKVPFGPRSLGEPVVGIKRAQKAQG